MSGARRLGVAILFLVVGVLLLYLSVGQVWFTWHVMADGPFPPITTYRGSTEKGFSALALGSLAAGAALLATKGRARLAVALITVAMGAGMIALVVHVLSDRMALLEDASNRSFFRSGVTGVYGYRIVSTQTRAWPYLALVAGGLIVLGALMGALAAGGGSLSAKYEPPTDPPPAPEPVVVAPDFADMAAWQALDRDEDPTGG